MKKAVVTGKVFLKHTAPRGHPERPDRIEAILKALEKLGDEVEVIDPAPASLDQVRLVHDPEYVDLVKSLCEAGGGYLDPDTYISSDTWEPALNAVGAAIKSLELVVNRGYDLVLAAVRPPGHHAHEREGRGFCIFNNVAIASDYARVYMKNSVDRIAIVDVDVHWGDGTADIFYERSDVLYISLHQDPRTLYPFTGFPEQVGRGEGEGFTVNIPLPPGTTDDLYLQALQEIALPILIEYNPDVVMVSLGYDAHFADPLADLALTAQGYWRIIKEIAETARKVKAHGVCLVLEGGYNLIAIERCTINVLKIDKDEPPEHEAPRLRDEPVKDFMKNIAKVKGVLKHYWRLSR